MGSRSPTLAIVAKEHVTTLFLEPVSPLVAEIQKCGAWSVFFGIVQAMVLLPRQQLCFLQKSCILLGNFVLPSEGLRRLFAWEELLLLLPMCHVKTLLALARLLPPRLRNDAT